MGIDFFRPTILTNFSGFSVGLPWSRHLDDHAAQKAAPRFNCSFTLEKLWRGRKVVARLHKTRDHRGGDSTVTQ